MPLQRPKYEKEGKAHKRREYIDNGAFDEICERIASGQSVTSILRPRNGKVPKEYPSWSTFWRLITYEEECRTKYHEAKGHSADSDAEKLEALIEDMMFGTSVDEKRAKVAIDGLRWLMMCKQPKRYNPNRSEGGSENEQLVETISKLADKLPGA